MKLIKFFNFLFLIILVILMFFVTPLFQSININKYYTNSYVSDNKDLIFLFKKNNQIYINDQEFHSKYLNLIVSFLEKFNKMNYGEFQISKNQKLFYLIKKIYNNKRFHRKIYIPSGSDKFKILSIINSVEKIFDQKIKFDDFEEGEVFPDTYHYFYGQKRYDLLFLMKSKTNKILDELWRERNLSLPYKSKKEVLIMASIIEKEAGLESDKNIIASVLLNRLKIGMRLESDPTSQYANKIENFFRLQKNIPQEKFNLKIKSTYNTYYIFGLPSGSISNASYSSIYAAFNPAQTNYLYFISMPGEKKSIFTSSYNEHYKNLLILRKKQRDLLKKQ
jgi:UPF0755 protein